MKILIFLFTLLTIFSPIRHSHGCTCPNITNITGICCINTPGNYYNVTISSGGLLRIESTGVILNNITFNSGAITIGQNANLVINNTGNINLNGNTRFNVLGDLTINAGIIMQNANNTIYIENNGNLNINGNVIINTPTAAVNGFVVCGNLDINGNLTFNTGGSVNFCDSNNAVMRVNNIISGNGTFRTAPNTCHNLYINGNGQFNNTSVNFNSGIRVCVDGNITGSSSAFIIENCEPCGVLGLYDRRGLYYDSLEATDMLITDERILIFNNMNYTLTYALYDINGKVIISGYVTKGKNSVFYYRDLNISTGLYLIRFGKITKKILIK
jgi:hypothetical protein